MDDRQVDMVRDGFDIVIRGAMLADASVVPRHICQLTTVLVASPGYLTQAGVPQQPTDLLGHQLITMRFLSGQTLRWAFHYKGKVLALEPKANLALSDPEAAAQAAVLGLGIGETGLYHALPYLRSGQLKVALHKSYRAAPRELALQYPQGNHLAPRVRAVVEPLLGAFEANVDLQFRARDVAGFAI